MLVDRVRPRGRLMITATLKAFVALLFLGLGGWFAYQFPKMPWHLTDTEMAYLSGLASIYGFAFSLFGFLASAYAVLAIRQLRVKTNSLVRLPELSRDLSESASILVRLEASSPEAERAEVVSKIKAQLKSISKHGKDEVKSECKLAAKVLKKFDQEGAKGSDTWKGRENFWSLYKQVRLVCDSITNYMSDTRLGS